MTYTNPNGWGCIGSIAQVARDLDLTDAALRVWMKQADIDEGKPSGGELTTDERKELRRLRSEVRILEQERDYPKKATAFFAADTDQRTR
jgi:transposase